jgi:hypothetical protein
LPQHCPHYNTTGAEVVVAVVENNGMMPSREYLAKPLTPYPLPTKDGGVLRTIGDVRAYMLALPKNRELRAHWQHASRLFMEEASVAAVTRQVQLALFIDGRLDVGEFARMSDARRWRRNTPASS